MSNTSHNWVKKTKQKQINNEKRFGWKTKLINPLTSSLLLDVTRSMCRGSSVSVKETTEFLSFPSSRTCLWQEGRQTFRCCHGETRGNGCSLDCAALTTRWAGDRERRRTGSRGRCCRGVAWWQSTGSSQRWNVLWTAAGPTDNTTAFISSKRVQRQFRV